MKRLRTETTTVITAINAQVSLSASANANFCTMAPALICAAAIAVWPLGITALAVSPFTSREAMARACSGAHRVDEGDADGAAKIAHQIERAARVGNLERGQVAERQPRRGASKIEIVAAIKGLGG
jgi:hypothetical protein